MLLLIFYLSRFYELSVSHAVEETKINLGFFENNNRRRIESELLNESEI